MIVWLYISGKKVFNQKKTAYPERGGSQREKGLIAEGARKEHVPILSGGKRQVSKGKRFNAPRGTKRTLLSKGYQEDPLRGNSSGTQFQEKPTSAQVPLVRRGGCKGLGGSALNEAIQKP